MKPEESKKQENENMLDEKELDNVTGGCRKRYNNGKQS